MSGLQSGQSNPGSNVKRWWQGFGGLGSRLRKALPFGSGVIAALLALFLYDLLIPNPTPLTLRDVSDTVEQALASATPPPAYSALVYRAIQPSLVLIQTQRENADGEDANGIGSGVIIDLTGNVLTSLHVVADASDIQLVFADGTESSAEIIATVPENDIAVLQAHSPPALIIPATLGNPNAMHIGDEAYAVGNPFGLYGSMSAGVISGFDRSLQPTDNHEELKNLIQIDAAVNPGNSGGPLLNRYGHVVGIVVGIVNPTEDEVFIGIGFAVPINIAASAAGLPAY